MTHHLLASADFSEGAVEVGIEVDPKGLLFGREDDTFHVDGVEIEVCIKGKDTFAPWPLEKWRV